jgi:hypothetical protein
MVTFACADPAGSGVAACGPTPRTIGEGVGQSATGTATDKVGNQASTTVTDINVDLSAPDLSGSATSAPNGAGWYHDDVIVHWNCADGLSGLDAPCPDNSTVTGEGSGLKATATASDRAGNSTTSDSPAFRIDRTPPTTSFTAPSGWTNHGVDVELNATDNLSGVAATHYVVDGGATETGGTAHITVEGTHTLEVWSVDVAGNVESHHTATVRIDESAPSITHLLSPVPNLAGWNNSDVVVTFICDDQADLSGIAGCTGPTSVTTETSGHQVHGEAADNAGNTASDAATVKLDKTKPSITGSPDRSANDNGWYNGDVTVSIGEGADQHETGSAVDAAGNSDSATVAHLNVDKTAPVITGTATSAPNGAGWYNADVIVHWECIDALSGIDGPCPANSTISGDGSSLSASAGTIDRAGNAATGTLSGIKIDRQRPVTVASAPSPDYPNNWNSRQVSVTLTATDDLSGVARTYYALDGGAAATYSGPARMPRGVHTLTFWSKDAAGNVEDKAAAGHSVTIKVDDIAPSISGAADRAPNANGWYNAGVAVSFSCSDQQTAIASCSPTTTLNSNGANQSVTGTATDAAGNSATATVAPINIDKTSPSITPFNGKTQYKLGESLVAPTCQASDALSGLSSCSVQGPTGSGPSSANGVGDFVYTLTAADKAGNSTTQAVTLHVGYSFVGFSAPVGTPGHDVGMASAFKAGSTVPMKFSLTNASGASVQAAFMPVWLGPVDLGTTTTSATATTSTAAPTVGGSFKWDATAKQYVFTWQTPKSSAGHYFRVGVQLDSGDVYTTIIVLT